jgi:hypothetical protein
MGAERLGYPCHKGESVAVDAGSIVPRHAINGEAEPLLICRALFGAIKLLFWWSLLPPDWTQRRQSLLIVNRSPSRRLAVGLVALTASGFLQPSMAH